MEKLECELNLVDFLQGAEKLLKDLSLEERYEFIVGEHHKKHCQLDENCTFKPKISEKSHKLAANRKNKVLLENEKKLDPYSTRRSVSNTKRNRRGKKNRCDEIDIQDEFDKFSFRK